MVDHIVNLPDSFRAGQWLFGQGLYSVPNGLYLSNTVEPSLSFLIYSPRWPECSRLPP